LVDALDVLIDHGLIKYKSDNQKGRPIAIGIQGLADLFMKLNMPYESERACFLDMKIMEIIYFCALSESVALSRSLGRCEEYENSPLSKGLLQFDLAKLTDFQKDYLKSSEIKWDELKNDIKKYGVRNILTTALMPTASSAYINGNYESFEPAYSNLYTRRSNSGEVDMINKILVDELSKKNLWGVEMNDKINKHCGSIQNIEEIPFHIKQIFKTAFEIDQRILIERNSNRGIFIDQSQSFNIHIEEDTTPVKLIGHLYKAWILDVKTAMYYLRINMKNKGFVSGGFNSIINQNHNENTKHGNKTK